MSENQLNLDIYDFDQEQSATEHTNSENLPQHSPFSNHSKHRPLPHNNTYSPLAQSQGWDGLMEWEQENPGVMNSYLEYPFSNKANKTKREQGQNDESSRKHSDRLGERDGMKPMKFQLGQFDDQQLGFEMNEMNEMNEQDAIDKDFTYEQNNEYNYSPQHQVNQHQMNQHQMNPHQEQLFFKQSDNALNQYQNPTTQFPLKNTKQLELVVPKPPKPKRQPRKKRLQPRQESQSQPALFGRGRIHPDIEKAQAKANHLMKMPNAIPKPRSMKSKEPTVAQSQFMAEPTASLKGLNGWLKKKKPTPTQIRKDLELGMSKEEEFQQIQHLKRSEQLAYIQGKLRHYNQLKNLVLKNKSRDEAINKLFRGVLQKNNSLYSNEQQEDPKPIQPHDYSQPKQANEFETNSLDGKQMKITPELLGMLGGKFQLFSNYEKGKYEPGYKMSLASIANQFQLSTATVSSLYTEWLDDPTFTQRIAKIQNTPPINQSPLPVLPEKGARKTKNNKVTPVKKPPTPMLPLPVEATGVEKTVEMRQAFAERVRKLKGKGARLYYLDECHKETLLGTNRVEEQSDGNEIDFSLMAVLGITGRASWKVVRWLGQKYEQTNDIQQLYKNVRDDEEVGFNEVVGNNKSYLILDSSVVKSFEKIRKIEQLTNTKVLLLPQFSRQLNPLQLWFGDVRGRLRMAAKSLAQLNRVLQIFSGTDFGKYLTDSDRYMAFALQKQNF